jgi:hypothetical protein
MLFYFGFFLSRIFLLSCCCYVAVLSVFCSIACGQNIPLFYPSSLDETTIELREGTVNAFHNKLLSSQNIVLAGGGPVGVELAADIKLRYPEKR